MTNEEKRQELHAKMVALLGSKYVYFQPPQNVQLHYPAIIYRREQIDNTSANNDIYMQKIRYEVVVVDSDPTSEIVEKMSKFEHARHTNTYASDGMNHDVFKITY